MNQHKRRPRGIAFEVYDPWDGQWIVRHELTEQWNATWAASGRYSRHIRQIAALAQRLGRPDGKPIGLRTLKTRTTLIW